MELNMLLIFLCFWNVINAQEKTHYIGAVVDFASRVNKQEVPQTIIRKNLDEYEKFIINASANKADIIVFPECGLTSVALPTSQQQLLPYASVIPDLSKGTYNPCNDPDGMTLQVRNLSCAAQKYKIYVVANLPERWVNDSNRSDDTDMVYNTNIVFDRNGNLVAKYRKFNLFVEPGFSRTDKPELVKFKTDFGVTFGTFICFDILFKEPALELLAQNVDVTDIVYPTAWFSELPFLTAVQTQAGWAKANGVNLLSAGYNNPEGKSGGSGIFPVDGNIKYIMPTTHESTMIIHQVPIIKKRKISVVSQEQPIPINPKLEGMATLQNNLSNYTSILINETVNDYRLCHNEFCCIFDLVFNKAPGADYYYRMIVYEGVRVYGTLDQQVQMCGVAACTSTSSHSCGTRVPVPQHPSIVFDSISVKGDMFMKNSTFFPSYTDYYLGTSYNYFYNTTPSEHLLMIEMKNVGPVKDLLAFAIYGNVFSSSSIFSSSFVLLIVAFFISKIYS